MDTAWSLRHLTFLSTADHRKVKTKAVKLTNGNKKETEGERKQLGQQSEIDATSARCAWSPSRIQYTSRYSDWSGGLLIFFERPLLTHLRAVTLRFRRSANSGDILAIFGDIYKSGCLEHATDRTRRTDYLITNTLAIYRWVLV